MTSPDVSVVVCTRDRSDSLQPTLASLATQKFRRFEVIVVDQSADDLSARVVDDMSVVDDRFVYIRLEQPGLSRAYNFGIARAKAPLIAFTDDDCVAPPDWLESVTTTFHENPGIDLVYGQVLTPVDLEAQGITYEGIPIFNVPKRRILDRHNGFEVAGMGANFAARRTLFEKVGVFDEVLGGGGPLQSSQDFDFMYRVFRRGYSTLLEPDIKVYHYGYRDIGAWKMTLRSYGIGVGAFFTKHARLGDIYATRLLAKVLGEACARSLKHLITRQNTRFNHIIYMRALLQGVRRSFRFPIDPNLRLYKVS